MANANTDLTTALNDLIAQYNATPTYTPKTDEQIRAQAEGEYTSYYDQLRLSAQQKQAQSDLALQQQRDNLTRTYQKQLQQSALNYRKAYSQADRQLLSRGMQRSSYAAQSLANISMAGAAAQQDIADQQAQQEGQIDAQRTQIAQQLAEQLTQYDASQAADVMNRIRQLEDQEYERGMTNANTRNQLSAQIYQFLYQAERDKITDAQWQKQFDESVRQYNASHSSSSGGGGSSRAPSKNTDKDAKDDKTGGEVFGFTSWVNNLGGASKPSTTGSTNGLNALANGVKNLVVAPVASFLSNVASTAKKATSGVDAVSSAQPASTKKTTSVSITKTDTGKSTIKSTTTKK